MTSPIRVMLDSTGLYYPFGNTRSQNVLEGFNYEKEKDHISSDSTKVLFLGCGDLRNAVHTATTPCKNLQVHVNDSSQSIIARNILLLKVISAQDFNPDDGDDFTYLWDIWYNLSWPESTQKRFIKDVKDLLNSGLPDQVCVPKSNQKDTLVKVWRSWLTTLNEPIQKVLQERSLFMTNCWNRMLMCASPNNPPAQVSFSEAVLQVVSRFLTSTEIDFTDAPLKAKILKEARNYFETGNCRLNKAVDVCVNPTLLQPNTKHWCVHYSANPFDGYLPLPRMASNPAAEGILIRHCQKNLKILLVAYRKRTEETKFFIHLGDAINFCYEESPVKFDIIDCSNLADHLGLANVLIATSRRLASERSLLLTESMTWSNLSSSVVKYIEESLCSPLSMIPTLYGLMLMNRIELGSESPRLTYSGFRLFGLPARLRWKKLPPSLLPLNLSPSLESCIEKLRKLCFVPLKDRRKTGNTCGLISYTPFTFDYILSDLSSRHPSADFSALSFHIPRVFHQTLNTIKAWRENKKKILRVTTEVEIGGFEHLGLKVFEGITGTPALRLVLVPFEGLYACGGDDQEALALFQGTSEDIHHIDNFDLILKKDSWGNLNGMRISFLIEDERLLETHFGIVMDVRSGLPAASPTEKWGEVDVCGTMFDPFTSNGSCANGQLRVQSCLESEEKYQIRLEINCDSTPSGLQISTDVRLPCESAHKVTLSLNQMEPLTIAVPYPILADTVRATLRRKDRSVDLVLEKATYEPWPAEFGGNISTKKWNPEHLRTWDDKNKMALHLNSQFPRSEVGVSTALNEVREIIRCIIVPAVQQGEKFFAISVQGSKKSPNWYIRAHPPVLVSPQGAPILVLSVVDQHSLEKLNQQGKIAVHKSEDDFDRIFLDSVDTKSARNVLMKSVEEVRLIRYVLRLNSTKILPNRWQRENLPRGDYVSWFPTFVSPLYLDTPPKEEELIDFSSIDFSNVARRMKMQNEVSHFLCAKCGKEGEKMKRCSRCKVLVYCSVECQRADWKQHKTICAAS